MLEESKTSAALQLLRPTKLSAPSCKPKAKPQAELRTKCSAETDYVRTSRKAAVLSARHWQTVQLAAAFARETAYIIAEMLRSHGNSLHQWL